MVSGERFVTTCFIPPKLKLSVKCSISQTEHSAQWEVVDMAEDQVSTATMSRGDFSVALEVIKISVDDKISFLHSCVLLLPHNKDVNILGCRSDLARQCGLLQWG